MTHACKARAGTWSVGAILYLSFACMASAGQWQANADISAAAEEAARASFSDEQAQVTVAAAPIDTRLRVPLCDQPLAGSVATTTQTASRVSAEVRCNGSRPWRLFVPVDVSLRRILVVAAVPLERGKVLTAGDMILAEREISAVPGGYLTAIDAAAGQVLRRSIPEGAVLSPALLDAPVLIRRGQQVTLEARMGAIAVQMAGVARGNGALGEIISVENTASKKVLQGIVRNEKSVEVLVP